MKISKILSICAIIASAFAFNSCNSEVEGTTTWGCFANYMGTDEDGYSRFVYSPTLSSSDNITILSRVSWQEGLAPQLGTRIVSYFQVDVKEEFVNNIKLQNVGVLKLGTFADVEIQAVDNLLTSAPLYLISATRAGNYIDIAALASPKNTELKLICDQASLDTDTAELTLVYTDNNQGGASEQQYYASFDISAVLSHPNIKSISLKVNNLNGSNVYILPAR